MAVYSFSFSYSRWSLWKKCPAAYKYKHIDKMPEPPSKAMERGNKAHQAIADFVANKSDAMPEVLSKFTMLGRYIADVPEGQKAIEQQLAFDRDHKPCSWFGPNAYWRFIWDAAIMGDKTVDAVDWKTGQPRGSYDDQMQIFAIPAYWQEPELELFTGHLIYLDTGDSVPYKIDRAQFYGPSGDPAARDGLYGLWMNNVAAMESDCAFLPKPSQDACRWCHFNAKRGGPCKFGV